MRILIALIITLWLVTPAPAAPPLHLEATSRRSEFVRGDIVTIDAYLFNDGTAPAIATLGIRGPAGFELVQASPALTTTIAPGRASSASFGYLVLQATTKGLATFVVVALDDAEQPTQEVAVVVRIGPLEWPPPRRSVYLPVARR